MGPSPIGQASKLKPALQELAEHQPCDVSGDENPLSRVTDHHARLNSGKGRYITTPAKLFTPSYIPTLIMMMMMTTMVLMMMMMRDSVDDDDDEGF